MLTRAPRPRYCPRRRDDRGAAAVITAIVCTVLFMIAALCLDLGNAFARRTDTQTQADYGALAAARLQTETAKSGMTIPTAMVDAVRVAMNNNQPQDDSGTCWRSKTCVTSAQLTDGNLLNGEIRFCSGTGVRPGVRLDRQGAAGDRTEEQGGLRVRQRDGRAERQRERRRLGQCLHGRRAGDADVRGARLRLRIADDRGPGHRPRPDSDGRARVQLRHQHHQAYG